MKKVGISAGIIKVVNAVGQFLSFFVVLLWLVLLLNTAISGFNSGNGFITDPQLLGILEYIKYWATLVCLALSGLEFALKNIILFIIYAVAVAGCVVLMFVGLGPLIEMLGGIGG